MDRYIWVERKFSFGLPAWMYPNTVERARGGPARVEEIVKNVSEPALINRIGKRWSIKEHIGHLGDLESLWAKRLDELVEGSDYLTAWEETNRATYEANHNEAALTDLLSRFRKARTALVERLDHLEDSVIERTALHPRLKTPMRTIDLVYFFSEHDDHHLAEITRLKNEFCSFALPPRLLPRNFSSSSGRNN